MFYIIQENLFNEKGFNHLIDVLDRFKLNYEIVKVRPFINQIEFKTNRTDVFLFGSVKASLMSTQYGWVPGTYLNENHDYKVYADKYGKENMLNGDSEIIKFTDNIDLKERKFIRPTGDTKLFTGAVFDYYEWEAKKDNLIRNSIDLNTTLQVASIKKIYSESRFWIVNNKIVTYSTYRVGAMKLQNRAMVDTKAIKFCKEMIKKYQLADAYVIDIAHTKNGYKIIECGCINCAGFYDADMVKLISALEKLNDIETNE